MELKNFMKQRMWLIALGLIMVFLVVYALSNKAWGQSVDSLKVTDYVFGELSLNKLIGGYIFVTIGLLIRWIIFTKKGVKKNERTPERFSLMFWIKDNLLPKLTSLLGMILLTFIIFRFAEQYIGQVFSMAGALAVGLGWDYYVDKMKNLQPDRVVNKIKGTYVGGQ